MKAERVDGTVLELETEGAGEELLDLVIADERAPAAAAPRRIDGVVIGRLAGFDASGQPLVAFAGATVEVLPARAAAALGPADVGREVALLFKGGDPARPIALGLLHTAPAPKLRGAIERAAGDDDAALEEALAALEAEQGREGGPEVRRGAGAPGGG